MFESGFELFWKAWPKSVRKGGKSQCIKIWAKSYCESCSEQIVKHVEWMKTTDQWRKDNGAFIPAPSVYLNQQRWDGAEVPDIAPKAPENDYLKRLDEHSKNVVPMPAEIKAKLMEMKK